MARMILDSITPPLRWARNTPSCDHFPKRNRQLRERANSPVHDLTESADLTGSPPVSTREYKAAKRAFDSVLPPSLYPPLARVADIAAARRLLRHSREFAQLAVVHPLLTAVILTPVAWGVWENETPDFERTIEYRQKLGLAVLHGHSLKRICNAAGVSWHVRGVQASAPLLIEANTALRHAPRLVCALPPDKRGRSLWAVAIVLASYQDRAQSPAPASHLVWAAQNADALMEFAGNTAAGWRFLPRFDSNRRLTRFLDYMQSTAGQELGFSAQQSWRNVQRHYDAWQRYQKALREARRTDHQQRCERKRREREQLRERERQRLELLNGEAIRRRDETRAQYAARYRTVQEESVQRTETLQNQMALPDANIPDGRRIVVLRTQEKLVEESRRMQNCLGGSNSGYSINGLQAKGRAMVSLRDGQDKSVACFEIMCPQKKLKRYALQNVRGWSNKQIKKKETLQAIEDWISFLNEVAPDRRAELAKGGPFDMRMADAETLM